MQGVQQVACGVVSCDAEYTATSSNSVTAPLVSKASEGKEPGDPLFTHGRHPQHCCALCYAVLCHTVLWQHSVLWSLKAPEDDPMPNTPGDTVRQWPPKQVTPCIGLARLHILYTCHHFWWKCHNSQHSPKTARSLQRFDGLMCTPYVMFHGPSLHSEHCMHCSRIQAGPGWHPMA